MSIQKKEGLLEQYGLDENELNEISQLAQICNQHDHLDLKLNWNTLRTRPTKQCNDLLFYVDGQLVGFLALFNFNSRESEVSGMVHPNYRRRGIFSTLFHTIVQNARQRSIPMLLLIVEQASSSGQAFVHKLPATHEHSEYKMVLTEPHLPDKLNERLFYRPANQDDLQTLSHITAQAFEIPEEDVTWLNERTFSQPNHSFYVGEVDHVIIGKIDVILTRDTGLIVGFAVLTAYQGQGYGRQILTQTVQEILKSGRKHIWLEVSTVNKHALTLYQSCGFKETGSYDYYSFPLL